MVGSGYREAISDPGANGVSFVHYSIFPPLKY